MLQIEQNFIIYIWLEIIYTVTSEYSPSVVAISADFAAMWFIFHDKIRLVWYEKFSTMWIFLKK